MAEPTRSAGGPILLTISHLIAYVQQDTRPGRSQGGVGDEGAHAGPGSTEPHAGR